MAVRCVGHNGITLFALRLHEIAADATNAGCSSPSLATDMWIENLLQPTPTHSHPHPQHQQQLTLQGAVAIGVAMNKKLVFERECLGGCDGFPVNAIVFGIHLQRASVYQVCEKGVCGRSHHSPFQMVQNCQFHPFV